MTQSSPENLFRQIIGPAYETLPCPVRKLHDAPDGTSFSGFARVLGGGAMASLVGRLVSLPSARDSAPLNVIILKENGVEEWHRDFDGDIMRSTLRARDGRLSERLGAARFEFALLVQDNAIIWQLRKVVFLGVPLPIVWFREVYAREYSKAGRYRFDVGASLPLIGRLIQYRGELLTEEIDEDVETTHSN